MRLSPGERLGIIVTFGAPGNWPAAPPTGNDRAARRFRPGNLPGDRRGSGPTDTVSVPPGATLRLAVTFGDDTDPPPRTRTTATSSGTRTAA